MRRKKQLPSLPIAQQIAALAKSINRAAPRRRVEPEAKVYYVYALIDPRNEEAFYIGKGVGDRCYRHAKMARQNLARDNWQKRRRIQSIHQEGYEVKVTLVATELTEVQAFVRERHEILERRARGARLTNSSSNNGGTYTHQLLGWVNRCIYCYGYAVEYEASVIKRERREPTQEEWDARTESLQWFMGIRQMLKDKIAQEEAA